ncbi:MAG: HNH endonuclease [Anaerolineae bacterium]|nr:HNH endonuclease [Anaerolineae bacterium]
MYGRVLLLNGSTWEPIDIISVPRAINLVLSEKAQVVEESGRSLRTVSAKFPVPSVIVLHYYVNVPRRGARWSRRGVLARDGYVCVYCGSRPGEMQRGQILRKQDFTVDHIIPKSRGGVDGWTNTACACYICNHRKGSRLPSEAGMKLRWEPKTPRTSYLVISIGNGPETWKKYIEID